MSDKFTFDKFMEKISPKARNVKKSVNENPDEDDPNRLYDRLYRERWQNRIVWGPKKNVKK